MTPPRVGAITSYGLVGMMIGALGIGTLTDVIGRRKAILISVAVFSVFTGLCALAPSPAIFRASGRCAFRPGWAWEA